MLPGQPKTCQKMAATSTAEARPPMAPSTVFLGLISVSLVLPKFLPTKYAPAENSCNENSQSACCSRQTPTRADLSQLGPAQVLAHNVRACKNSVNANS
jgi:hypothetical protein